MAPGRWTRCARVLTDFLYMAGCLLLAAFIALPSLVAYRQRARSREGSEVAAALTEFAAAVKHERRRLPIAESLLLRARRLDLAEMVAFEFVHQLPNPDPEVLAEATQRLALRLKRRVAFERKMLARTASGRRRGAFAAALPGVVLLALMTGDAALPFTALGLLLAFEGLGCWLLWQVARVEA
jgi:Flp pilus assembly protein TadB